MLEKITNKIRNYLKPRLIDLYQLFKEIVIFIIGFVVFSILIQIGILYTLIKHLYRRDYSLTRQLRPIIRSATLAYDGLANAASGELLNDLLKPKIKYGKWHHTISAVTGINFLFGIDNKFRKLLDFVLGKNHCVDAVTDEMKCYYGKNN